LVALREKCLHVAFKLWKQDSTQYWFIIILGALKKQYKNYQVRNSIY